MHPFARTSWRAIEHGGAKIELIETWPCSSEAEAEAREAYHILRTPHCVNKVVPSD